VGRGGEMSRLHDVMTWDDALGWMNLALRCR